MLLAPCPLCSSTEHSSKVARMQLLGHAKHKSIPFFFFLSFPLPLRCLVIHICRQALGAALSTLNGGAGS